MASQARQRRSAPPAGSAAPDAQLREFYRDMVLVRRFEERASADYRAGKTPGGI